MSRCRPLLLALLVLSATAFPVLAAGENRIGYVSFEEARIQLRGGDARIEVDYTVDPGMGLIILLFGSGDLQKKVERSLNFPEARAVEVGLSHAVFLVDRVSEDYGNQAYWFPAHTFGVTFPLVEVSAPGFFQDFTEIRTFEKGFGYFERRF